MKKLSHLTTIFILLPLILLSQNTKYRNSKYDWEPVPPHVQIEERYKNEDAVIIDEDTKIEMVDDNMSMYNYYLTKMMRIRYQTANALKKYSTITLPESSRIHRDLPYMIFYFHERDFGKVNMYTGEVIQPWPYTWEAYFTSEVGVEKKNSDHVFENNILKDHDNLVLMHYIDNLKKQVTDTNDYFLFHEMHKDMIENFNYQTDSDYVAGTDQRKERLGDFFEGKTIREISRYHIYNKLLYLIRANYFKVRLYDKRVQDLNFERYTPSLSFEPYYCFLQNKSANYFIPKKGKFGWYENELPFYYEDVNTELVTQNLDVEETYKKLPTINFERIKTPYSTLNDNYRNHNVMVTISTELMRTMFDARVELSGQFSTMTRGYYLDDYKDLSVNELYNRKISDLGPTVKTISQEKTNVKTDFPFTATFRLKYEKNDILTKATDGTMHLNLSNWFSHIIYKNFSAENRKTDFYFDFQCQDSYKYFIKTDLPVTVVNEADFATEIKTVFGSYSIVLSYPQPGIIQLESNMIVKDEHVAAKDVASVATVFNAIEQLNKKELVLKLQ